MDFETFSKLSTQDVVRLFTATLIQSDSSKVHYKVFLGKKSETGNICDCPAGRRDKPCKHIYRAQVKNEFKDAWWLWMHIGRSPQELWDKCMMWATSEEKVVSKLHHVKNNAIRKFLEYVKTHASEWISSKLEENHQNRKFVLAMMEGRVDEGLYEKCFNQHSISKGHYRTLAQFCDVKYVVDLVKKHLEEDPEDFDLF